MKTQGEITADDVKKNDLIIFHIYPDEIFQKNYERIDLLFDTLLVSGKHAREKILFNFLGCELFYEKIYKIEKVKDYLKGLFFKYPFMFYFISKEKHNQLIIFLSLCSSTRDNKNYQEILTNIFNYLIEYAATINDNKNAERMIKDFFLEGYKNKICGRIPNLEEIEEFSFFCWRDFSKKMKFKILNEKQAINFILTNRQLIEECYDNDRTTITIREDCVLNLFPFEDLTQKVPCPKCGNSKKIIYKPNIEKDIDQDSIFIPSYHDIRNKKIKVESGDLYKYMPIPIEPYNDKWICSKCGSIYNFKYFGMLGLEF